MKTIITVQTLVKASIEKVWNCWINPDDIAHWHSVSEEWYCQGVNNNFYVKGSFDYRMESRKGQPGYSFAGVYDEISEFNHINYTLLDGRKVRVRFLSSNGETEIIESIEAESNRPIELQQRDWQAILNSFKKYLENR